MSNGELSLSGATPATMSFCFSPTRTNLEKTPGGVIALNRKCTNQYSSGQKNNASPYVTDTHKQLNEGILVHFPLLSIVYGFQSVSNVARSL